MVRCKQIQNMYMGRNLDMVIFVLLCSTLQTYVILTWLFCSSLFYTADICNLDMVIFVLLCSTLQTYVILTWLFLFFFVLHCMEAGNKKGIFRDFGQSITFLFLYIEASKSTCMFTFVCAICVCKRKLQGCSILK